MGKSLEFTCDKCGSHRIEEVVTDATVITEITEIDSDLDFEYAKPLVEVGRVTQYQCLKCGATIKDVEDAGALVEFLEQQAEEQRRDEKRGLYPDKLDYCN